MKPTNNLQSDKQRNDFAGISGCVNLTPAFSLASHNNAPHKITAPEENPVASQHDSLFGMLMGESFLSEVFGEAINDALSMPEWASQIDASIALDGYDMYMRDRTQPQPQKTEQQNNLTRGFFALGEPNAVRGLFNNIGNAASALIRDAQTTPDMGAPDAWVISAMGGGMGHNMAAPRL